jgi:uncharacterized protein (TIGR03435 family)
MLRRFALLPLILSRLAAQPPTWQEFSIGPAIRSQEARTNNVRQGLLRANSVSLKSLIGIATGVPAVGVLGPDWMDSEHYAVVATLAEESRLRLRTREPDETRVVDDFRSLLTQELVRRFHLEYHRETRDNLQYTLQPVPGRQLNARQSAARERGRMNLTGTWLINRITTIDARGITFGVLRSWLQNHLKAPVALDPAIPAGPYDFHLKFQTANQPSLFEALQSQLGLELFKETRRQEFLVVDRVERLGGPVAPTPAASEVPITAAPDSSVTFTPAQLRRDLRVVSEALQEGHPGIYRYTPKPELDRVFDRAAAQLSHPMTALEFYRVLAPAVARVKCGHTALRPSRAIQQRLAAEPLLPVETAILGGKVYVARDFSEGGKLPGADILAINNVAIGSILASMLAVVHGDGDSATAGPYQLSHDFGFARNLYLIAGLQSPFRVRYATGGTVAEETFTGMLLKSMREAEQNRDPRPQAGNATWRLLEGRSTGVLKITAFAGAPEGDVPWSAFFQRVFTELREKNVSKVILDVRDNGGGEDELGRELFAYFADGPFRYYRDLIVNKLSFHFFQYVPDRTPLPANVHEMVKPGADGKYHVVGHPNWGVQQPTAPHFGGKVVVLINGGSFSTTCEFLAALHNHGGPTFVGEETAGGYYGNTSGADVSMVLPSSKLILPVQLVGYYMAIEGATQGAHGIRPDQAVEYSIEDILAGRDRAMEMAMRL